MILDDWQKEALEYEGNLLLCTGRQNGKTFIMSRKIGKYMLEHAGCRIIVASLTEDQAKLIIVMTLDFLEKEHKNMISKGKNKPTQNKITLTNKSTVIARPVGTTGDAIRGFTGDVLVLDEVSRFSELVLEAATPVLFSTGGNIWLCSTPFGKKGYFWNRYNEAVNLKDPKARFHVIKTNSEEVAKNRAINEDWTERNRDEALAFLEKEKAEKTDLQYGQEYLGLFTEDLRQFFPDRWIDKVCTLEIDNRVREMHSYYEGSDVGRIEDPSTFTIIDATDERRMKQTIGYELKEIDIPGTYEEIKTLDAKWNFVNIGVDDRGIGKGVLDLLLRDPQTKRKSIGLDNAKRSISADDDKKPLMKEDMYVETLTKGNLGELNLLNLESVRNSIKSVQYEYQNGKMIIFGNNTHMIEGIIRAVYLVKTKGINILNFCNAMREVYGR